MQGKWGMYHSNQQWLWGSSMYYYTQRYLYLCTGAIFMWQSTVQAPRPIQQSRRICESCCSHIDPHAEAPHPIDQACARQTLLFHQRYCTHLQWHLHPGGHLPRATRAPAVSQILTGNDLSWRLTLTKRSHINVTKPVSTPAVGIALNGSDCGCLA